MADVGIELARLGEQVTAMRKDIQELHDDVCKRGDDHEDRLRKAEAGLVRMEEKQKQLTGLLAGLQVVMSGITAWWSSRV